MMLMMMVEDMVRVVLMIILRKVLLYRMESSDRLSLYVRIKATSYEDLNSRQMCHFKLPILEQVHINKVRYRNGFQSSSWSTAITAV